MLTDYTACARQQASGFYIWATAITWPSPVPLAASALERISLVVACPGGVPRIWQREQPTWEFLKLGDPGNVGALTARIGFWDPLYYNYNKDRPKLVCVKLKDAQARQPYTVAF